MSTDSLALLFVGAFISWLVLGILYSIHADDPKPARNVLVMRIRIERMTLDDFYEGCYRSLLNEVSKKKDNL